MKLFTFLFIATLFVLTVSLKDNKQKHKFITLDNLDPNQLGSLLRGDWKAMLPEAIKKLMKTQKNTPQTKPIQDEGQIQQTAHKHKAESKKQHKDYKTGRRGHK